MESNPLIDNCTIINKGIKRVITNFVYNRKSYNASSKVQGEQTIEQIKQTIT